MRVAAAGVCHSDLHLANGALGDGRWPMVLGHEGAGIVEEVGEGVTHVAARRPRRALLRPVLPRVPVVSRGAAQSLRAGRRERASAGHADGRHLAAAAADGTPLQHGLHDGVLRRVRTVVAAGGVVPTAARPAALAGGAPRLRRRDRLRRRAQRRSRAAGRERRRDRGGRRRAPGARRGEARRRRADRRRRPRRREARSSRASAAPTTSSTRRRTSASSGRSGRSPTAAPTTPSRSSGVPETMLLAWKAIRPGATAVVVGLAEKGVDVALPAIEFLSDKGIRGIVLRLRRPGSRDLPELAQLALAGELDLAGVVTPRRHARRRGGGAGAAPPRRGRAYHPRSRPRARGRADSERTEAAMTTTTEEPRTRQPTSSPTSTIRAQAFIDGELRRRGLGRDVRLRQPDRRRGRRHGRRLRRRPTSTAPSRARAPRSSRASGRGSRRRSARRRSSGSRS